MCSDSWSLCGMTNPTNKATYNLLFFNPIWQDSNQKIRVKKAKHSQRLFPQGCCWWMARRGLGSSRQEWWLGRLRGQPCHLAPWAKGLQNRQKKLLRWCNFYATWLRCAIQLSLFEPLGFLKPSPVIPLDPTSFLTLLGSLQADNVKRYK